MSLLKPWHWLTQSDAGLLTRVVAGSTIFLALAIVDLHHNGRNARRWREYCFLFFAVLLALAYGATVPVFGEFPGSLDNGGETLRLVKPGGAPDNVSDLVIDDVRYNNNLPWSTNANGFGPSLQLIDPTKDNYRPGNWTTTATNALKRVTPGATNSVRSALSAFPLLWINEVLPANVSGPQDNAGENEPFIELYNSGATSISLGAFYLTDSYTNLNQWQFL